MFEYKTTTYQPKPPDPKRYDDLPDVLDAKQAAEYLGVSRTLVYELLQQRKIPHRRMGARYLIPRTKLKEYLEGEE